MIKLKYRAEISAGKHAVSKSWQRGRRRERKRARDLLKAKPPRQTEASRAAAMSPTKRKKATEQKKKKQTKLLWTLHELRGRGCVLAKKKRKHTPCGDYINAIFSKRGGEGGQPQRELAN